MKYSKKCPKCASTKVIALPVSRYNQANYIYLNAWATKYLLIERYICGHCGLTEEYAQVDDKFRQFVEENKPDAPRAGYVDDDFV